MPCNAQTGLITLVVKNKITLFLCQCGCKPQFVSLVQTNMHERITPRAHA